MDLKLQIEIVLLPFPRFLQLFDVINMVSVSTAFKHVTDIILNFTFGPGVCSRVFYRIYYSGGEADLVVLV